ncbi:MAG: hypothetical protein PHQ47_02270 [Candidatus Portnoybacteria bacterium]|nr:hypothetical protein [Candidatus Portnoybacteria bacterium]
MKRDYFLFVFAFVFLAALAFGVKEFRGAIKEGDSFSESIEIESPLPDQIIKGSVFFVKGRTKDPGKEIFVELKDKNSGQLLAKTKAEIFGEGDEKNFQARLDTAGKGGWATLDIYSPESTESRISFAIKISLSF